MISSLTQIEVKKMIMTNEAEEKDRYGMTIPTPQEREENLRKIRKMANQRRKELALEKKRKNKT